MSFFFYFIFFSLSLNWERERVYNCVQGETILMFTYLDGFLWRIFSLLQANGLYVIFSSGLKVWLLLLVQDSFRFLYPESWHGTRILSRRPHLQNWFSYSLFGFCLLPSPVRRFVRATICPCTPFFTHPVTKYKHLLVSILLWISYLRNWPKFLFQRSVLGLLIQIRRNSSNPPLLLSQWETTWQYQEIESPSFIN